MIAIVAESGDLSLLLHAVAEEVSRQLEDCDLMVVERPRVYSSFPRLLRALGSTLKAVSPKPFTGTGLQQTGQHFGIRLTKIELVWKPLLMG